MRATLIAAMLALAPHASSKEYPAGYWDRVYTTGETAAATYMLSFSVKDLGASTKELERRLAKAGANLLSMNSSPAHLQAGGADSGPRYRMLSYSLGAKSAESVAKGLFDMGELQSYASQPRQRNGRDADELREKISVLSAEAGESACLTKMPVAASFLNGRLSHLKQALAAMEGGSEKAHIQISLFEADWKAGRKDGGP